MSEEDEGGIAGAEDPTAPLTKQLEAAQESASLKTPVVADLFERFRQTGESVVYQDNLRAAIHRANAQIDIENLAIEEDNKVRAANRQRRRAKKKHLSTSNLANFLKDIIRTPRGNNWWPASAKEQRITGRQRYGKRMVFQFSDYIEGYDIPFPDRFAPNAETRVHDIASVSLPHLARMLGRTEETWLTQIAVNLRIVETHMAVFSDDRSAIRDITHLQMGMKTQPEIDATFIMTLAGQDGSERNVFITCEAKQFGERLLEDQIKTQVARAMEETERFSNPPIHAVKPLCIQVWEHEGERLIYVVEFREFEREEFNSTWKNGSEPPDDERLYQIDLYPAVSHALYRPRPSVPGINASDA